MNLGVFGLITNLAFSLVWQFVDMSTWQNVIASSHKLNNNAAKQALKTGGLAVFIAPGVIGTLLGVFLAGTPNVNDNNIMTKLVEVLPYDNSVLSFAIMVALLASIMSTIDGPLLAASYAFVCDFLHHNTSLMEIDSDEDLATKVLISVRIFIGVIAIAGTIGVFGLLELGISLFDIVYVLIICQLALTGPVLAGLWNRMGIGNRMIWAIVAGLLVGFGAFGGSQLTGLEWLHTGAGFFTMLASATVAFRVTTPPAATI